MTIFGRRVLMLLENHPYPQDDRVRREAKSLTAAGYQITVIAPCAPEQPWSDTINNVRVYRYPPPGDGDGLLGYLWEYGYSTVVMFLLSLWVFVQHGFDILHVHNPPDTLAPLGIFYKLFGVRFVFDHHDLSPEMYYARFHGQGNRLVHRALLLLEWLTFRTADLVLSVNQSYKMIALDRGGVPEKLVSVVRNGPDLARLKLSEPDPELRAKASTIIGYVGVMGFQDGVDYLLRALHHLVTDLGRGDFYCVIIGKGDAWESLQALSRQLGLQDHVLFPGRISDAKLLRYLSTVDICVDPDPANPFNDRSTMIKMMEYMALGKPIVAFDLTEHRVSAQEAAMYVRPNDELEFARQILALMCNPARREQMGRFGYERVTTVLAWQHQEQHLLEAYASLGAGHNPPTAVPAHSLSEARHEITIPQEK